jgi:hypothetical protein
MPGGARLFLARTLAEPDLASDRGTYFVARLETQ